MAYKYEVVSRFLSRPPQVNWGVRPRPNCFPYRTMPVDFPVTRQIIEAVDGWIATFSAELPDPVQVPLANGGFQWAYDERSPRVVQMAKAVRMASGIRAAMLLADAAFVAESASLLRMVSDFGMEITAIGEGMMRGQMTAAQQRFVDQFFAPFPSTPAEFEKQEREFYVSREELMKSEVRLANDAELDGEHLRSLRRYINKGYDSYVHGAYPTAMQLYHGGEKRFRVEGTADDRYGLFVAKAAVAGKLHELIVAVEFMAHIWRLPRLHEEVRSARKALDASGEQSIS